jgi:hypothetical protein
MVYSLLVITVLFSLAAMFFFGLFVDAYLHVPAKVKIELRHEHRKRH